MCVYVCACVSGNGREKRKGALFFMFSADIDKTASLVDILEENSLGVVLHSEATEDLSCPKYRSILPLISPFENRDHRAFHWCNSDQNLAYRGEG